jgi:hypothetical protein
MNNAQCKMFNESLILHWAMSRSLLKLNSAASPVLRGLCRGGQAEALIARAQRVP